MALIKTTAFLDSISGKVNGSVFARNKGGAYVRSKGQVTNPQSNPQMTKRALFGGISQAWRSLTDEQRSAWNSTTDDYPYQNSLGETKFLSGFALHQKLNSNLLEAGGTIIDAPLAPEAMTFLVDPSFDTLTPTAMVVDAGLEGDDVATQVVKIFATEGMSPGVSNFKKRLRALPGVFTLTDIDTGADILSAYESVFGTPAVGFRIGIKMQVHNLNTGQVTAPIFTSGIVTSV